MRTRAAGAALLLLALVFKAAAAETDFGPPGKPKLTSCLSRDKETFTCWWKPSEEDDGGGGLRTATSYSLYYRKENSDVAYECPDYRSAGGNSCYFNKNNTSIWVNYNITVVASNARGSSASEPVVVDVAYIVQPHTPENVTVSTLEDKEGTFFRVSWEPPRKADTRSGWITLVYELRATLDGAEWEEHYAGQQKMFNMFGLRPGGVYLVQVRCKPIHGFWSEWSPPVNVTAPDAVPQVRSTWLLVAVFSALAFLVLTFILNVKSSRVKRCLFPPVPGPKIRGLDIQLLKNGRSEDVLNALAVPGFPPAAARNCDYENLLVYLEVGGPEEQELTPTAAGATAAAAAGAAEGPKSSQGTPPSDSDSGRGSCDSRTLLMEKCGEGEAAKEEERGDGEAGGRRRRSPGEKRWWESRASWEKKKKTTTAEEQEEEEEEEEEEDASAGRVQTWPSVFVPPDAYAGSKALGAAKQLCYSDRSLPPPPLSPSMTSTSSSSSSSTSGRQACGGGGGGGYSTCEEPRAGLRCQERLRWQPYSRSELSIHSLELVKHRQQQQQQQRRGGGGGANAAAPPPPPARRRSPLRATEYVEVQRVSRENVVVLRPISISSARGRRAAAAGGAAAAPGEEDYSRVKGLNCGDVPLLQRAADAEREEEEEEEEEHPCDMPSREGCYTAPPAVPSQTAGAGKPSVRPPPAASLREDTFLAANGYVDTAVAMTPTY